MIKKLLPLALAIATVASVAAPAISMAQAPPEYFGIVGRDPWYEFNTDPVNYPDDVNKRFLENMASQMSRAGARWVRIEFHTEYDQPTGPGDIDWRKYDWFINECAPKHGLKVLALLNSGILSDVDPAYRIDRIFDHPDGLGEDPNDGTNEYIRAFRDRARGIADRYGSRIAAYEIFNEPNISTELGFLTHWTWQEIPPERFANLMVTTYKRLKEVAPDTPIVLGGLLPGSPAENPNRTSVDYLNDVYASAWVQDYYKNGPHYNGHPFPFDGIGIHPFFSTADEVSAHVAEVHQKMLDWGDGYSKIWITEVGFEAEPPPNAHTPESSSELAQSQLLNGVYTTVWDQHQAYLGPIFWFKYEDFYSEGYKGWGLVRLKEDGGGRYNSSGEVGIRKAAYLSYNSLANPASLPTVPLAGPPVGEGILFFPETGHSLRDGFRSYWERNGGLARFGYPLTEEFEAGGYVVQYFERARFEYHPEFAGTPYEVELGLLGTWVTRGRTFDRVPEFASTPEHRYFKETGHTLNMGFKDFWERNGGLAIFGLPISEEILEVSPDDGKSYTVQYFERARFEYHPEHAGTPHEVQLGLLGRQVLESGLWYR